MTLGKLIQHALNLCDGIVEAQEALGNLGVRESSFHEPLDWLRWGIDPGEDSSVKDMCDTCDTEALGAERADRELVSLQKLRDLLSSEMSRR